jgi:aminoglycoside phosphotransferase (APT) family kinase protein
MTIVEYVDGTVVSSRDDLAALSDTEVGSSSAALVTVLAFVHPVDRMAVGLEKFDRPEEFVAGQVNLLARQWDRVNTHDLPDVAVVRAVLADALPRTSAPSIARGDFRIKSTDTSTSPG